MDETLIRPLPSRLDPEWVHDRAVDNGKPWTEFNPDKETIVLKDLTGTVAVTAQY